LFQLLRYYSICSALLVIVATILLSYTYWWISRSDLVYNTELENKNLGQILSNTFRLEFPDYITSVSGVDADTLRARRETKAIHRVLAKLTKGLPILKVKIYNIDGLTIYSSEARQIGEDKGGNPGFKMAVTSGLPASKLSYHNEISAFSGVKFDRNIVESYIPVSSVEGSVAWVFELYTDVTSRIVDIQETATKLILRLLVFFTTLYGLLFLVVRRADQILKSQYSQLTESAISLGNAIAVAEQRERELKQLVTEREQSANTLKLSEERYRELFDESPVAIWEDDWSLIKRMLDELAETGIKDLRGYFNTHRSELETAYDLGRVINISLGALEIYGAANEDELVGINSASDAIDDELDAFLEILLSFSAGEMAVDIEALDNTMDGSEIMVRRRVVVPPRYRADWSRVIFAIEDITNRSRMEEALRNNEKHLRLALNEAESANRSKTMFMATMSHELRTPLSAIIGFSETMARQYFGPLGSPQYVEYAKDIQASGEHLLHLINDILDLSAIDAGKHHLHMENLNFLEVLSQCNSIVAMESDKKGVGYICDVPDNLPWVFSDERALKQILLNIISNAIKFTPRDGEVIVNAMAATAALKIIVRDTGIGIPEEGLDEITDPFKRGSHNPYLSPAGTGLGLAIVKSLVDLHGGELMIQSKVGEGTVVTVSLPLFS
jgi:signal transduction histidine kinase